ncbi:hypothetical protein L1049_012312 [Liquidambar formosana]|uniref:Uncharacterized protein n=1 Tax=Liquidambar formosana TaxID=63359 RepID=A0AAP0RT43_LIQFO
MPKKSSSEQELRRIVFNDEKDNFVKFLTDSISFCDRDLLERICMNHAVNCATSLLQGELPVSVDAEELNARLPIGWHPIHVAARSLRPSFIDLFIRHGARTDIRLNDPGYKGDNGLLPLNIALNRMCEDKILKGWTPRQTIFDLISILCLPELKDALDAVRLLASSSMDVGEIAYCYAMEGKPIQLAILLMVARERVLGPITFQSKEVSGSDRTLTLCQCIKNEITTLNNEFKSMEKVESSRRLTQMRTDKMVAMKSMLPLLGVFEWADDIIEEYRQLGNLDEVLEHLIEDVVSRLVEKGFDLKALDSDIGYQDWNPTKHALEESAEESYPLPGLQLPFSQKKDKFFYPRKGMLGNGFPWSSSSQPGILASSSVVQSIHTRVSKCNFSSLYSKNVDVQVKKKTKATEQHVPKFPASKKWAYFSLAIRRGIRRA